MSMLTDSQHLTDIQHFNCTNLNFALFSVELHAGKSPCRVHRFMLWFVEETGKFFYVQTGRGSCPSSCAISVLA